MPRQLRTPYPSLISMRQDATGAKHLLREILSTSALTVETRHDGSFCIRLHRKTRRAISIKRTWEDLTPFRPAVVR